MLRYRARIEYDGTDYFGFQRQREEQPTIQGSLEAALEAIAGSPATVLGAGRTDSGVHARGQVIAFDLEWRHGPEALRRALNASLPIDIAVLELAETTAEFHPRYDARRRAYEYRIFNSAVRSPLHHRQSWHVRRPLDVAAMNRAARTLVGVQDFATFGRPPQGENTVRELFRADWERRAPFVILTIEANAFLYRMVRSLVGTMTAVGDGTWTVEAFIAALAARDRGRAGRTSPPQGLFLLSVTYDDE